MIKELIKLSNHLDNSGLHKESDYLDEVIKRVAAGRSDGKEFEMPRSRHSEWDSEPSGDDDCRSCDGEGKVFVPAHYRDCEACDGKGHKLDIEEYFIPSERSPRPMFSESLGRGVDREISDRRTSRGDRRQREIARRVKRNEF